MMTQSSCGGGCWTTMPAPQLCSNIQLEFKDLTQQPHYNTHVNSQGTGTSLAVAVVVPGGISNIAWDAATTGRKGTELDGRYLTVSFTSAVQAQVSSVIGGTAPQQKGNGGPTKNEKQLEENAKPDETDGTEEDEKDEGDETEDPSPPAPAAADGNSGALGDLDQVNSALGSPLGNLDINGPEDRVHILRAPILQARSM